MGEANASAGPALTGPGSPELIHLGDLNELNERDELDKVNKATLLLASASLDIEIDQDLNPKFRSSKQLRSGNFRMKAKVKR